MNNYSLGVIGYVSPPSYDHPESFLHNFRSYKRKHPTILFSDHPWLDCSTRIGNPEIAKTKQNSFALNNSLFIVAIKMATQQGWTHMMFIEQDCRFASDNWDDICWQEFLKLPEPKPKLCGSVMCFNPFGSGMEGGRRFMELQNRNKRKGFPIPCWGTRDRKAGAAEFATPCVFVNGAIAIYEVQFLSDAFPMNANQISLAKQTCAFDWFLGQKLVEKYGLDAFKYVHNLSRTFSSYGNVLSTEKDRIGWLEDGTFIAVHQVDSAYKGPRE